MDFNKVDTMMILLKDVFGKINFEKAYLIVR
jgi:hypothetical protein